MRFTLYIKLNFLRRTLQQQNQRDASDKVIRGGHLLPSRQHQLGVPGRNASAGRVPGFVGRRNFSVGFPCHHGCETHQQVLRVRRQPQTVSVQGETKYSYTTKHTYTHVTVLLNHVHIHYDVLNYFSEIERSWEAEAKNPGETNKHASENDRKTMHDE